MKCVNKDKLALCYIEDVKSVLQINSLKTGKFEFKLPLEMGTISGFSGDINSTEIFYQFVSFLTPGIIYYYDFAKGGEPRVLKEVKIANFNKDLYEVEQVFYHSKDQEKIPMFIVHKKSKVTIPRPCLLYGYGGFNICIQPSFSITGLVFIDSFDGILAYPNIRGGGEYGESKFRFILGYYFKFIFNSILEWHNGGRLLNKQNVFNDFQAAAEYLVENQNTTANQIAIQGGSNGGLLVGACINQRPDLFSAAIAQVGYDIFFRIV